ncbi:tetratricopeptide repeat protein [Fulvivirga sp. M361]|uniref:tetratricopeptide repeat protein n=1 Tax=Fulvivirga sp. M361 TaxID=2594266 RepID=UPI00117AD2B3|nr:tetratricopeptide repeat protein [Fulvivirga sp. M361]TRX54771.1 tetratricopeptide repeat protein [Fulvivirga sp. M361]
MKKFIFWLFYLAVSSPIFGQSLVIDSLKTRLQETDLSSFERKELILTIAKRLSRTELPDEAIDYLDKAIEIRDETDSLDPIIYQEYTRNYYLKGDFLKALEPVAKLEKFAVLEEERIHSEAPDGIPTVNERFSAANAYTLIGEVYRKLGDFEKALRYALKSQKLAERLGNQKALANNYNNIAIIYKRLGNLEKAKEFYWKALHLNEELNRPFNIGSNYNNIGLLLIEEMKYDSALIYYQAALKLIESAYGRATIFNNVGHAYFNLQRYDSSEYYHRKAFDIEMKNGFKDQMSLSMINIAGSVKELGRYNESIQLAEEAYTINEQEKNYNLLNSAALVLSNAYEKAGDLKNSLFYFRKHKQYHDSVYNENKQNEILNLQLKFNTAEKERENELLRQKNELNKARIKQQYIIGIVLAIILLLSIWILGLSIKRSKTKQELTVQKLKTEQIQKDFLEKELTFKNRELTNFALQIVERNEFIADVTREIEKWSKNGLSDDVKVKELVKKIKENESINRDQKEFDAHVSSIYESFYNKLEENYSDLTRSEKRLAVLLRLKLSSKEISSILGISPKSVDMSRYRLRKKLELTNEDDLVEMLNQL